MDHVTHLVINRWNTLDYGVPKSMLLSGQIGKRIFAGLRASKFAPPASRASSEIFCINISQVLASSNHLSANRVIAISSCDRIVATINSFMETFSKNFLS